MTLTPEEQALLDARREMLRAGDALDDAYVAFRCSVTAGEAAGEHLVALVGSSAAAFDRACRAYDAAYRAAYDRSVP